jgi:hypothetical protein
MRRGFRPTFTGLLNTAGIAIPLAQTRRMEKAAREVEAIQMRRGFRPATFTGLLNTAGIVIPFAQTRRMEEAARDVEAIQMRRGFCPFWSCESSQGTKTLVSLPPVSALRQGEN